MTPFEIVEKKLREGSIPGNRHATRRDIGRLAGGYLAAHKLNSVDVGRLGQIAAQLSDSPKPAMREWQEAVEYGQQEPIRDEPTTQRGSNIGWNDAIWVGKESSPAPAILNENWVESAEIVVPGDEWDPVADMIRYLELVFDPDEHVCIVAKAWQPEGSDKWIPHRGVDDRTRAQLVEALQKCKGDIGKVIGDQIDFVGGWVRINPMDGSGQGKDANVKAYRHALIEADGQDLGKQLGLIRELQLPCSAVVHSGGKSIHAIVRVEAESYAEYQKKVDKLYEVCQANGLKVDQQNRNPSRLSRLPGILRGDAPQFLVDGRCGKASFDEWVTHIEEQQDSLPDPEPLPATAEALPALGPELIAGLLREGHKMRLSGPSKAGKSFSLIELAISVAEGRPWMGFPCVQGPVLYVNLELDGRSCLHRFHRAYEALGWPKTTTSAIDVWNLRGHVVPLDSLAPKLIRRARGRGYKLVILDPIYKIQTGDENDAGDVARFCNHLDMICNELGTAVVDCHHHSKGLQGQKRAMDRASGSGVFGRDPDAILDLIELEIPPARRAQLLDNSVRVALEDWAAASGRDMDRIPLEDRGPTDRLVKAMQHEWSHCQAEIADIACQTRERVARMSGWRLEGSLREFPPFDPVRFWFQHPIHTPDTFALLSDAKAAGEEPPWEAARRSKQEAKRDRATADSEALEEALETAGGAGHATVKAVAESLGKSDDTVRRWIGRNPGFEIKNGVILEASDDE